MPWRDQTSSTTGTVVKLRPQSCSHAVMQSCCHRRIKLRSLLRLVQPLHPGQVHLVRCNLAAKTVGHRSLDLMSYLDSCLRAHHTIDICGYTRCGPASACRLQQPSWLPRLPYASCRCPPQPDHSCMSYLINCSLMFAVDRVAITTTIAQVVFSPFLLQPRSRRFRRPPPLPRLRELLPHQYSPAIGIGIVCTICTICMSVYRCTCRSHS